MCIYLMSKFNWSLLKALEFINYRRPNLEIRASFLQQLANWQQRRLKKGSPSCSETWDAIPNAFSSLVKNEEAVLRNTYINAQLILQDDDKLLIDDVDTQDRLEWNKGKKRITWSETEPKKPVIDESSFEEAPVVKVIVHRLQFTGKSIMKKAAEDEVAEIIGGQKSK